MVTKEAIDRAIAAHGAWRKRLESAIASGRSEFTVDVVRQDFACQLGQWLNSLAVEDRTSEHFEKVRMLHVEFHAIAGAILDLALKGAKREALKRMEFGNEYTLVSGRLVLSLTAWKDSL